MKLNRIFLIIILSSLLLNCTKKTEKDQNDTQLMASNSIVEEVNTPIEPTLFERLGGFEGISKIVDEMIDMHMQNPLIKDRFIPLSKDPENFKRIKQNVKDFLAAGSGGEAVYKGRDLPTAHKGMNSTEVEFIAATDDLLQTLRNNNIDEETQKDVLFIVYSLKDQVIGK